MSWATNRTTISSLAAFLAALCMPLAAQNVAIIERPLPTAFSDPLGITAGPDGALWFTESGVNKIGRITTAGAVTEYPLPTALRNPIWITAGPDGALWFTGYYGNQIGRITTAGAITEYPLPTPGSGPQGITAGPDGALWFTESDGNKIGRITTAGAVTEYPVPTALSGSGGITAGPDGALWFTEEGGNKIGRITTAGAVTEYPVPTSDSHPAGITGGLDGALWFTEFHGNKIGRITTAGAVTEYALPAGGRPGGITAGPDGALWFTDQGGNKIGRITTAGVVTEYPVPTAFSELNGITAGPDGALWFTESLGNKIGRVVFPTAVLSATPLSGSPGSTATLTGSGFAPGESVNISTVGPAINMLGTLTADGGGSFVHSGPVRQAIFGSRSLVAVGQTSGRLGVATFSVTARLILSSATGTPGSAITAQGFGFGAGEQVNVYWNTPRVGLATVTTNAKGSFTDAAALTFTIPAGATTGINGVYGQGLSTQAIGKGYITVQ